MKIAAGIVVSAIAGAIAASVAIVAYTVWAFVDAVESDN